jgi:hypothetical protein
MRPEWRRALVAVAAIAVGATCSEAYARLAAPYYAAVARLIAIGHPWEILTVRVTPNDASPGSVLRLDGNVRRDAKDSQPAAEVFTKVQVGASIEGLVVFWTLLLLWPAASTRQQLAYCAVGLPMFLGLEAMTTAAMLVNSLAEASAVLAGDNDPLTGWELWSRFLQGGGKFALEVCWALFTVVIARSRLECARPG